METRGWTDPDPAMEGLVDDFRDRCIRVYAEDPNRVEEDAGKERGIAEGGYGRKRTQVHVQNAVDAIRDAEDRSVALERFKSGEIKVLTNYAVLSQGFDAPKTDAVYITRPTSSEVRYQQMVGRGLRGPKNGGTEEVLIVNMLDNLIEFADSIVYESLKEITEADVVEESAGVR